MNAFGGVKARVISTFAAQLITLVYAVIDPITGFLLRNVFPIHTLKGVLGWRNCKVRIIFVDFIYRVVGDTLITFFGVMGTLR